MAISDDPKLRDLQTELTNCHSDLGDLETAVIQLTAENEALRNNNEFIQNAKPGFPFHKITDQGFQKGIEVVMGSVVICVLMICVAGYFIADKVF